MTRRRVKKTDLDEVCATVLAELKHAMSDGVSRDTLVRRIKESLGARYAEDWCAILLYRALATLKKQGCPYVYRRSDSLYYLLDQLWMPPVNITLTWMEALLLEGALEVRRKALAENVDKDRRWFDTLASIKKLDKAMNRVRKHFKDD